MHLSGKKNHNGISDRERIFRTGWGNFTIDFAGD